MILNESKRDELLMPYVQLMASKGIDISLVKLKKDLLKLLVEEAGLRNLSLGSNFYLAGAAKYYFNGELTVNGKVGMLEGTDDVFNKDKCKYLNEVILILRNSYVDSVGTKFELEEDFGKLSLDRLIKKYNKKIKAALGIVDDKEEEEEEKPIDFSVGDKGYTFDVLYSYDDARKYYEATSPGAWCITYGKQHYDAYIRRLNIHYVIFRQNGYENVPRRKGENWSPNKPQDEYGNSLIALLQSNVNGEPIYITSRWNHGHYSDESGCEADHAYTKEEFLNVVGMSDADLQRIFQIWKEHKPKTERKAVDRETPKAIVRNLKYKQMRINGGESPESVLGELKPDNLISGNGTWAKSVAVLKDVSTDTPVYVLVDRGNILFETIVENPYHITRSKPVITPQLSKAIEHNPEIENRLNSWSGNELEWARDVVVIKKPSYRMIYNTRLHQFVNVDGITKFKYTIDYCYNTLTDGLYEVAMAQNQRALISIKTNQPLKLPNGAYWFEYTDTHPSRERNVHLRYMDANSINDSGIIRIVYDSSAEKEYYYDIKLNKFIDVERLIDNLNSNGESWELNIWASFSRFTPLGVMVFNDGYEHYALSYRGQIMEINGHRKFDDVEFSRNGYGMLLYGGDSGKREVVFYNFKQGTQIELPQEIHNVLLSRQENSIRLDDYYPIIKICYSRKEFLFEIESERFLVAPTMSGFTYDFNGLYYRIQRDSIILYLDKLQWLIGDKIDEYRMRETWDDKCVVVCLISDLIRGHISTKDDIDKFNASTAQQTNESVKINIGDIKAMVTEALNKILKGH